MNEMISLGTCPTCGGPAQFIEGGTIRHVPLHRDQLERVTEAMQSDVAELLAAPSTWKEPPMPTDTDRAALVERLNRAAGAIDLALSTGIGYLPSPDMAEGLHAAARALSEGEALRAASCRVLAEHDSGALVSEHQDAVYAMEALRRALAPAGEED